MRYLRLIPDVIGRENNRIHSSPDTFGVRVRERLVQKSSFGNAISHEVVEVEWDRAIRNSFVSENVFLINSVVLILKNMKNTHIWFSGRTVFSPKGVSNSYTLEYNQSLSANPPTSTTYRRWFGKRYSKNEIEKNWPRLFYVRYSFVQGLLWQYNLRMVERIGHVRPKSRVGTFESNQMENTHPVNFNWPKRMLKLLSLSLVDPNLMYWGSSAFLNRSLVVMSKQWMICSKSSTKGESAK